jgi:hypothetical protein
MNAAPHPPTGAAHRASSLVLVPDASSPPDSLMRRAASPSAQPGRVWWATGNGTLRDPYFPGMSCGQTPPRNPLVSVAVYTPPLPPGELNPSNKGAQFLLFADDTPNQSLSPHMTAAELRFVILSRMKRSFPTAIVGFREWIFSANTGTGRSGGSGVGPWSGETRLGAANPVRSLACSPPIHPPRKCLATRPESNA